MTKEKTAPPESTSVPIVTPISTVTSKPLVVAPKIILPTTKSTISKRDPGVLIIFSKPKVGKTTLLAQLPNCLILDFEKGTRYVEALKMDISSYKDIKPVINAIIEAGYPYKYLAIDTVTALEDYCIPLAEVLYADSPIGKTWFDKGAGKEKYGSIINLPNGAGYQWTRLAFSKLIEYIKKGAPNIILLGHVKDSLLEKNGVEFSSLELDLTGKTKRTTASNSDAIGYLYRKGNKNIISFKTTDEVSCGARSEHLRNKEIIISELTSENELITHWDQIYID